METAHLPPSAKRAQGPAQAFPACRISQHSAQQHPLTFQTRSCLTQRPGLSGVQRVFASNYTAEVRYVGTRGIHLPTQIQYNVQPRVNASNQLFTSISGSGVTIDPTGSFGTVNSPSNANTLDQINQSSNILPQFLAAGFTSKLTSYQPYSGSSYNGLQTNLTRRYQHGFLLNASYTWSKTMDDATAEVFATVLTPRRPQNSQDLNADYSRSALDRTNRLSLAIVYDLPYFKHSNYLMKNLVGNWTFSPIYTYESPEYATALSGVNANLNGDSTAIDRPIVNPNGVKGTGSSVLTVYASNLSSLCPGGTGNCSANTVGYVATNPNAYYIQAGAGTLPTAARNTLPIRPIDNVDLSASKRINITERIAFQFQAQAFNLLDHPQYIPGSINTINTSSYTSSTQFQDVAIPHSTSLSCSSTAMLGPYSSLPSSASNCRTSGGVLRDAPFSCLDLSTLRWGQVSNHPHENKLGNLQKSCPIFLSVFCCHFQPHKSPQLHHVYHAINHVLHTQICKNPSKNHAPPQSKKSARTRLIFGRGVLLLCNFHGRFFRGLLCGNLHGRSFLSRDRLFEGRTLCCNRLCARSLLRGLGAGSGNAGANLGVEVSDADGSGGLTQPLKTIKSPLFRGKYMDDEVDVVHQNPFALATAFDRVRINAKLALEAELDLVGDRNILAIVSAVADKKVVGEAALRGIEGEDANVFSFLVFAGGSSGEQELVAFN